MKSKELEAIIQSFGKVIEETLDNPDKVFSAVFGDTSEPAQAKTEKPSQPEHMLSLVDHKGNVVGMIARDYVLEELLKKRT